MEIVIILNKNSSVKTLDSTHYPHSVKLFLALFLLVSTSIPVVARKPPACQFQPRPFPEVAADFNISIEYIWKSYQRMATDHSTEQEINTYQRLFADNVRKAFATYRIDRKLAYSRVRCQEVYIVTLKGKQGETRMKNYALSAPAGRELLIETLQKTGSSFADSPSVSPAHNQLLFTLRKRGDGTARARLRIQTRYTGEMMEKMIAEEIEQLRRKLALHNLPSDITISAFRL